MSVASLVRYASLPAQPWKNGKGVSRTLFSDSDTQGAWTWKVSVAEISQPQPYSQYPEIRRIQVALGPGAIDLTINGHQRRLHTGEHVAFDGDEEVTVIPRSPGFLALNLMFLGDRWDAHVEALSGTSHISTGSEINILVALDEDCTTDDEKLSRLDSYLIPSHARVDVRGSFHLLTFTPLGETHHQSTAL